MPKPMEILIQVEEAYFGKIWRMLDTMKGVALIQYKSEGVKGKSNPDARKVKHGSAQSSECIVLGALIAANSPLSREALSAALEANGKRTTTIAGVMNWLRKKKQVTVKGSGTKDVQYSVTKAGKKRYETACQISKD